MLKDMPLPVLVRSLPKILLYQGHNLSVARGAGAGRTVIEAWRAFLEAAPATLQKRRAVMRQRAIETREFRAMLRSEYPVPTGLTWPEIKVWFKNRIAGPLLRLGGDLLEYVPETIRPRIRERDRRP
jgi:hypothetical protein